FKVGPTGITQCCARVAGYSHHEVREYAKAAPVVGTATSTIHLEDSDDGRLFAQVRVHATHKAASYTGWSQSGKTAAAEAGVLFEREWVIRYKSDSHGLFQVDPASEGTEDEVGTVAWDKCDDF